MQGVRNPVLAADPETVRFSEGMPISFEATMMAAGGTIMNLPAWPKMFSGRAWISAARKIFI